VRVLQVTDPHLFADPAGELRGVVTETSLSRVLDHYRGGSWSADIVVATGDLVQDESTEAYERFASLLGDLGKPVHIVPGNHDDPEHMHAVLGKPPFFINDVFEAGGWLIAGLDTCLPGRAGGAVADRELDRLDAILAASDAGHAMVCLHHPPVAMGSRWLDSVGMDNGDAVIERLASTNRVRAMLFGHVHQAYDAEHAGIRVIGTPSTCRQFKPKSDEFAVDDLPPAYRRLELHPDGTLSTELVWI